MLKYFVGALALLVATTSYARDIPTFYTEERQVGSDITITHGTYVCEASAPKDIMSRLINIQDDRVRRRTATQLGCEFMLDDREITFRVVEVVASLCLDRQIEQGSILLANDEVYEGDIYYCGREGHEFMIYRNGVSQRVILLTLDITI